MLRETSRVEPVYIDIESVGFHGFVVLIQYAYGNGDIVLYDVWEHPVQETLDLIESFYLNEGGIIGFNLCFDGYHLIKCFNTFRLVADKTALPNKYEVFNLIPAARDGPCLKPKHIFDIFLHARKGPYQNLMDRKDIRIKKLPGILVNDLVRELEQRVQLNPIFFARRKDKTAPIWQIEDSKVDDEVLPGFADIVLRFAPSSGLKALAVDALKIDTTDHYDDVQVKYPYKLEEYGYDPCHGNWPELISYCIAHWKFNARAREYARNDVEYTRMLYKHFGSPPCDDHDSILAGLVPPVRFKGYRINIPKIKELLAKSKALELSAPKAPKRVKMWLSEVMDVNERIALVDTAKETLKEIATWKKDDGSVHPAAERAIAVAKARNAEKLSDIYEKLIQAGRLHVSLKVIGALSGRMAGADDLNCQGIPKLKIVRECFGWEFLIKGDYDAFEASIAAAAYKDDNLTADLMSGKKVGGLMGVAMHPDMDYDEVMATEATADDKYKLGKNGFFASVYFGNEHTLEKKYGIPLEIGKPGLEEFNKKYKGVGKAQTDIINRFTSITQPNGIGSKVYYKKPEEYVESLLGFRRYFTLENKIVKALFDLANKPPDYFKKYSHLKVIRREKVQTPGGAVMSALYGAAMGLQGAVIRAAGNTVIQATGAQITKNTQVRLWELQPCGIHEWVIQIFQVHDEILGQTDSMATSIKTSIIIKEVLDMYRPMIPLIGMKWHVDCNTWGDKE